MTSKANQLVYVIFIIVNYMLKSNANNLLIRTLTNGSSAFSATFDTHKEKNVKISLFSFVHFQSKFGVCVCVCVCSSLFKLFSKSQNISNIYFRSGSRLSRVKSSMEPNLLLLLLLLLVLVL